MKTMETLVRVEKVFYTINVKLQALRVAIHTFMLELIEKQTELRLKALSFMALQKQKLETEVDQLQQAQVAYKETINKLK